MSENTKHEGNYKGTAHMEAENQNMEFVNDTINGTKNTVNLRGATKKDKQ